MIDYDPAALPVPHGYALSPDREALIRSRPPTQSLVWAAAALGAQRVVRVRALRGGSSSAMHVVTTDTGDRAVLRRWVVPLDDPDDADVPERETKALKIMQSVPEVPTPELIACDIRGANVDVPSTLMSLVPGSIDWSPAGDRLDDYLRRLVVPLLHISDAALPTRPAIPTYRPYEWNKPVGGPRWTRLPQSLWTRAAACYLGPPPSAERRFIHRDYHPGNVLWRRHRVSGVVDWGSSSLGAPEVDVGHCRANLQGHFSMEIADRFLELWQSMSGRRDYHGYWDLAAVMNAPDEYDAWPNRGLDDFVEAAMRRV